MTLSNVIVKERKSVMPVFAKPLMKAKGAWRVLERSGLHNYM